MGRGGTDATRLSVKKACLFTDSLVPSGVGEHMLSLAERLARGYAVSLVCPPTRTGRQLLDRARAAGVEALGLEVRGDPGASRRLERWLLAQRVDVFHCHAGVSVEGREGMRVARAAGVPALVRTEHLAELSAVFAPDQLHHLVLSPYHRPGRPFSPEELATVVSAQRAAYLASVEPVDRVICVSAGVRDSFLRVGQDADRLRVVRNGIPLPRPGRAPASPERLGVPPGRRLVLTVGRFIDVKGHAHLLRAVPAVLRRRPEALFLWVGAGPLEGSLREQVRRGGLQGAVHFAGRRADVPELLAAADVFVLPSLVEGLPLVVLEALAAERPVVATAACGTREAVRDGVTGRLVPPGRLDGGGDPAPLAAGIVEALEDRESARGWGAAGRRAVEREFSADRMAMETAEVYEEVLEEKTRAVDGEPAGRFGA